MADNFTADISRWIDKVSDVLDLVVAASAQDVVEAAQKAVPVDTGFLRNSIGAGQGGSFTSTGPVSVTASIANLKAGTVLSIGWTAEYAAHVEFGARGRAPVFFARGAVSQWQAIVARNARRFAEL